MSSNSTIGLSSTSIVQLWLDVACKLVLKVSHLWCKITQLLCWVCPAWSCSSRSDSIHLHSSGRLIMIWLHCWGMHCWWLVRNTSLSSRSILQVNVEYAHVLFCNWSMINCDHLLVPASRIICFEIFTKDLASWLCQSIRMITQQCLVWERLSVVKRSDLQLLSDFSLRDRRFSSGLHLTPIIYTDYILISYLL